MAQSADRAIFRDAMTQSAVPERFVPQGAVTHSRSIAERMLEMQDLKPCSRPAEAKSAF